MKLAATVLAALSLIGCATDNDGEGGGQLLGLRPAKPSLDDAKSPIPEQEKLLNHIVNGGLSFNVRGIIDGDRDQYVSAETIKVPFPIEGLCDICNDGVIALPNPRDPDELLVVDDLGNFFCKIWVAPDGHIAQTDCR